MASRPLITPLGMTGSASAFQGLDLMGGAGGIGKGFSTEQAQTDLGLPTPTKPEESVVEKLGPGTDLHAKVINRLDAYFRYSAGQMSLMTPRWNWEEQRIQAYVRLPDYKQLMSELDNNQGAAPEPVRVIVPYSFATIHAAATFLASVLIGRRPIFPMMASRGTTVDKARYIESALQANIEASRGYEALWQFIWDSLVYSFGAMRIGWSEEWGKTLRIVGGQREITDSMKYAGNKFTSIDPYTFYPDPRVPIWEVARKGDFVFWTSPQSKLRLMDMQNDGLLKWVEKATEGSPYDRGPGELGIVSDSRRRAKIQTDGTLAQPPADVSGFFTLREGTVRLVPKDWGIGDSERSELWKFCWRGGRQIVQAEPLGMVHEHHPVATTEPMSLGYDFGSISMADMIGVFQDMMSWLLNSRMENVRTTINNQFLVDPGRIEMQDLRQPAPGRAIRLKRAAIGTDVREAFMQLQVQDTTQSHVGDINIMRMLADSTTGVTDNLRGLQTQGGRRSATEARQAMQAGASRLSQMAVRISGQGFAELADQAVMNIQQFMPEQMWIETTGDDGAPTSSLLSPDMIVGSFNYKISDGSLPFDKMAMLDVWKEIMMGVAQDPELRATNDLTKIFEYVAKLGGATNIDQFKKQQQPAAGPQLGPPPPGAVSMGGALPAPPNFMRLPPPSSGGAGSPQGA